MANLNNPAGRLLSLLENGRKISSKTVMGEAWAKLLDTSVDDVPNLLKRVGRVVELPAVTKEEVLAQAGINHDTYLKWLPQVEKAMSELNFRGQWQAFLQYIDDATLYGLEVCDDLLSRVQPTKVPDDAVVSEIQSEIRSLFDEVVEAELSADVRSFILRHLSDVDSALVEYRISGMLPVERAINAIVGDAVLKKDLGERSKESAAGKRFWSVMAKVAVVLATLNGAYQLTDTARNLLPEVHEVQEAEVEVFDDVSEENEVNSEEHKPN